MKPAAISSPKRGAGRAAAPKIAKQNTTEAQTQDISMIAMRQNTAFRVPRCSQAFDLEPVEAPIPGRQRGKNTAFDFCLATILSLPASRQDSIEPLYRPQPGRDVS